MLSQMASLFFFTHTNRHFPFSLTDVMGKPGSDAGMPGIEDSEVGKLDEVQFGKSFSSWLICGNILKINVNQKTLQNKITGNTAYILSILLPA